MHLSIVALQYIIGPNQLDTLELESNNLREIFRCLSSGQAFCPTLYTHLHSLTSTQAADKDIISEVGLVVSLFMYKPGITTLPNGENKLPSPVNHHPCPDAPSCPVEMFETAGHQQGKSDTRPSEQIHISRRIAICKILLSLTC